MPSHRSRTVRALISAVTLAAVIAAGACHRGSSAPAGANAAAAPANKIPAGVTPATIAMGDSLFNNGSCQRCHGAKGVGAQRGPSLVAGPWVQHSGSFEEIVATITNGVPRTAIKDTTRRNPMNARGGPMQLTDERVRDVASYVWSISRAKEVPKK